MRPRVAILIPTIGRPHLAACLQSVRSQYDGERIYVLCQKNHDAAEAIFDHADPKITIDGEPAWSFHRLADPGISGFGHDLRNFALDNLVRESHYGTVDDDDILCDGALDAFADAAFSDAPVTIFKTTWGPGSHAHGVTLWRQEGLIAKGEIATPMMFSRVGKARWGTEYFGDLEHAYQLRDEYPVSEWAWRDECVCEVRPVAVDEAA